MDHRFRKVVACLVLLAAAGAGAQSQAPGVAVLTAGFESGTAEGWAPRGTESVAATAKEKHTGSYSLAVSNRKFTWNGASHELPGPLVAGAMYRVSLWAMYKEGPATRPIVLSAEKSFADASAPHRYVNVKTVVMNKNEWTLLETDYTVSSEPDLKRVDVYVETPYKTDDKVTPEDIHDFYVDDLIIAKVSAAEMISIQQDIPDLHSVLDDYFSIGAAVPPAFTDTTDIHSLLMIKHFTALVAGNAMKPDALQPTEGTFTWKDADRIVRFAGLTGMKVRGHTLVWHNQIPDWFFTDPKDQGKPATRELLLQRMKTHIQTVVGHFKGDVDSWDVVNEVLSDRSGLRGAAEGSKWLGIAGPDYIEKAFQYAHEADPDATLVINDYNLESDGRKLTEMYNVVKSLLAKKVPVNAVGFQMHISLYASTVAAIRAAMEKIASLGVKVQVTEMDMSIYAGAADPSKIPDRDLLVAQGKRYKEIFDMFKEEAKKGILDMVVLWGCADDDTWLDSFPVQGRPDAPLLFDRRLQAKPAFWAIVDPSKM